jgi:hypothetical protein
MKKWTIRALILAPLGFSCVLGTRAVNNPGSIIPNDSMSGTGSNGMNGLNPSLYHTYQTALATLMNQPLASPAGILTADWDRLILKDSSAPDGGPLVFVQYVLGCALQTTDPAPTDPVSGASFSGSGTANPQLNIYSAWMNGGLSQLQQRAIYICLAARMNDQEQIHIWLEGSTINPQSALALSQYPVIEGYWGVGNGSPPQLYRWPWSSTNASPLRNGSSPVADTNRLCSSSSDGGDYPLCPQLVAGPCSGTSLAGVLVPPFTCIAPDGSSIDAVQTRLSCADCCSPTYAGFDCSGASGGACTCGVTTASTSLSSRP